mmetsp:Transcript_13319/g.20041  ORF Transcript_13319/g.20041 Transcript_13319/m.20041 type:complete len:295 (-) Transcript_13319:62-946(-)|eukprot:CAMPEP_0185022034 /NCGR_PEP_ID=MMETSP1103-20130426/4759_1 /TAXON_ID=36769 /ORGANISM="Paraphysomonas bandaiensis, Strain Caron Lab Isolate" /LENGTH=294 /DNA_ID=CAMNT_0027553925 /DNA_START=96 /DNA_END=980 /DNA_ORIENTATION=+
MIGMPYMKEMADRLTVALSDKRPAIYSSYFFKMLMVIDGVGLGIIAGCTTFEGFDDWDDPLGSYFHDNIRSIFFWLVGLNLAVGGLLLLIINTAAFESLPAMEHLGMAMLTFAPFVNVCAWLLLDTHDPWLVYNKQQIATEVIEFIGMGLLDLSYFTENHVVECLVELCGYVVLSMAAMLDIVFLPNSGGVPLIQVRQEYYHSSDVFGLFLLAIVSIGKFYISHQAESLKIIKTPKSIPYVGDSLGPQDVERDSEAVGLPVRKRSKAGDEMMTSPGLFSSSTDEVYASIKDLKV